MFTLWQSLGQILYLKHCQKFVIVMSNISTLILKSSKTYPDWTPVELSKEPLFLVLEYIINIFQLMTNDNSF